MYDSSMFQTYEPMGYPEPRRTYKFNKGAILIAIGTVFLLSRFLLPHGIMPLLIIGSIFTGLALFKGVRGLVVPGSILLGLAGGIAVAAVVHHLAGPFGGAAVTAGLGLGFMMIPVLDRLQFPYSTSFNWARIPGTILLSIAVFLTVLGTFALTGHAVIFLLQYWPILLIVAGLWLFISNRRRSRR